jgi:hypothetical protein
MRVPGFQRAKLGVELAQVVGYQEQDQRGRARDIGFEHIAFDERRAIRHACRSRCAPRYLDQGGVVFDAESDRAALSPRR